MKKFNKYFFIITLSFIFFENSFAIQPYEFVQQTADEASEALNKRLSKEEKMEELKVIAKKAVDIKGIGYYSLGKHRKGLREEEKKEYIKIFEEYFLKSFSSRLAEYTNPEIDVNSKQILNKNYTIVNSTLKATNERPEIKIDWRVYTKNIEMPLIRDLIIEGLSLARTQKEEFNSVLQSNTMILMNFSKHLKIS